MANETMPVDADEPETGRGSTDAELLALQRIVRAMEKLGDAAASRIACYLWMRYTGQCQAVQK